MKDTGNANYILEIKILRDHSKRIIGLSKEVYIHKTLNDVICKPTNTPAVKSTKLSQDMCSKTLA